MMDLFGEVHTSPQSANCRTSTENLAKGFDEFWKAWPAGPRKVAKKQALDKWARYECHLEWQKIVAHVEWMKTQDDWIKGFCPLVLTYLNQQRWSEWEQPKPRREESSALQQILAHKGAPMPADIRAKIAQLRGRA